MFENAKWIWISKEKYPYLQESNISYFAADKMKYKYGVAAFKKKYVFDKTVKRITLKTFADTKYLLMINGGVVGKGPCTTGGDVKMPVQYANQYSVECSTKEIEFYARVSLTPTVEMDNSSGMGGFILEAEILFEDDSCERVNTDNTWLSRCEREFKSPRVVDFTVQRDEWIRSDEIECIWNVELSSIKNLTSHVVSNKKYTVDKKKKQEFFCELDRIYSSHIFLNVFAEGDYKITFTSSEKGEISSKEHNVLGNKNEQYYSMEMDAVGEYHMIVENNSEQEIVIDVQVIFVCYPSDEKGYFKCSDELLNKIYDVGRWTVKICRQYIELDSPVHQENLHCVGDYVIESLVNYYTTGDCSLTRLDVIRLSDYLVTTKGYMYHNTYALLWIQMLYDYYMYSGDIDILDRTLPGVQSVLERFEGYENEEGLIENVTNYMFVDWTYIDGYSLHHPPKALGQTVINAFYYKALNIAIEIYRILGDKSKKMRYCEKCKKFKVAFNSTFFDGEKRLYFDGEEGMTGKTECLPENSSKRYYTIYSNTLAVLYDLCDCKISKEIIDKYMSSGNVVNVQPYFSHYLIEAIYKVGLFEKYGLSYIKNWKSMIDECDKGMKEYMHEVKGYNFDYSHGWSATPTYQLASKISGLEIIKAGFEEIRLKPNAYGLRDVKLDIPTPRGIINITMGEDLDVFVPKEIKIKNRK